MSKTIFNWTHISEALTGKPRNIRQNYHGKQYSELINELHDFECKWLDKAKGQKIDTANKLECPDNK